MRKWILAVIWLFFVITSFGSYITFDILLTEEIAKRYPNPTTLADIYKWNMIPTPTEKIFRIGALSSGTIFFFLLVFGALPLVFMFIKHRLKIQDQQEWKQAFYSVMALAISFELARRFINGIVNQVFTRYQLLIDNVSGGFLIALEMGIFCLLAIICTNLVLRQNSEKVRRIIGKVFLIAIITGFIVGVTYTAYMHKIYCGFVK